MFDRHRVARWQRDMVLPTVKELKQAREDDHARRQLWSAFAKHFGWPENGPMPADVTYSEIRGFLSTAEALR